MAPVRWQLTDRGIAVVLFLVAAILTASVVAIGVTALRVTSADYDAGLHQSRHARVELPLADVVRHLVDADDTAAT